MKKYLGKKEVLASSMSMGDAYDKGLLQSGLESSRVERNKQGYLVKYDNGYQSWSPKDVFDNSYKVIDTPLDRLYLECNELSDKYNKLVPFLEGVCWGCSIWFNGRAEGFNERLYRYFKGTN